MKVKIDRDELYPCYSLHNNADWTFGLDLEISDAEFRDWEETNQKWEDWQDKLDDLYEQARHEEV